MYHPDLTHNAVSLPEALLPLREQLAENIHDTWAAGRLSEGWKYGPTLDREQKLHPCLVPYDQLPESEKDYDRRTAAATIRCILSHGYSIKKEVDT